RNGNQKGHSAHGSDSRQNADGCTDQHTDKSKQQIVPLESDRKPFDQILQGLHLLNLPSPRDPDRPPRQRSLHQNGVQELKAAGKNGRNQGGKPPTPPLDYLKTDQQKQKGGYHIPDRFQQQGI